MNIIHYLVYEFFNCLSSEIIYTCNEYANLHIWHHINSLNTDKLVVQIILAYKKL